MKTTIALLALLLAGCNTVQSVREEGARTTHDLQFAPFDAAGCMARNIEAYWHGMHTSHHRCVVGSAAIFAMSAAKSSPVYSK